MSVRPRFVFDTNAVVGAALLKHSLPRQAFDKAIADGDLLVSVETLSELNEVLGRPGFARYVSEEERLEFLAVLLRETKLIEAAERIRACRHPSDDKFIELAVSGNAKCIVSGDSDLLRLNPFRGVAIVTPRGFLSEAWKTG